MKRSESLLAKKQNNNKKKLGNQQQKQGDIYRFVEKRDHLGKCF